MNICDSNKAISLEVKKFISNVPDVKEESITDYLVWKWHELDTNFKYINISTFTRQEESIKTGADFEIELWLVGKEFSFSLVFQAKKFVKPYDSYINKLNYPSGTQNQLKTLLNYAKLNKRLPFYIFYSTPDKATKTMCPISDVANTSIFMADAHTIKKFADGKHGKKVSKDNLLKYSNPFHCMFCCSLTKSRNYFSNYFSTLLETVDPQANEILPSYVNMLLNGQIQELNAQEVLTVIDENKLRSFRAVGVYDMRDLENM